jgi:hypothetical protein
VIKSFLGLCILGISTFGFAEQQTWYFVRHFEKQLGDNPSLTDIKDINSIVNKTDYGQTRK